MFGKIATCVFTCWLITRMSRCYQIVIHVQLTYFYLCIFHWRPTDNLYHCWVFMYYRLNRWFFFFCLFLSETRHLCVSAIAKARAAPCTVTERLSGRRKRVRHKVMSRDQSVILRGWLIVVIKSIIKAAVTERLAPWGQSQQPRPPGPWDWHVQITPTNSHAVSNLLIQQRSPVTFSLLNIENYYNIEVSCILVFGRVRKTILSPWPCPSNDLLEERSATLLGLLTFNRVNKQMYKWVTPPPSSPPFLNLAKDIHNVH